MLVWISESASLSLLKNIQGDVPVSEIIHGGCGAEGGKKTKRIFQRSRTDYKQTLGLLKVENKNTFSTLFLKKQNKKTQQ